MDTFSLKADRADVIVPAAEIFLTIAKVVRSEYIHVPVIGLADGIIDSLYENKEGEN
jgi:exopolyphosphatase/guanosine-5'-triphosphate,3'-diphosphate pyrophosphatase